MSPALSLFLPYDFQFFSEIQDLRHSPPLSGQWTTQRQNSKKRKWRMLLLFILAVFTVAVFAILFFFHTRNVYLHLKKPTDDNTACLYVLLKVLAFSETQISLRLILTDCSRTKPAKKLIFG